MFLQQKSLFISGTSTDVGKSLVTAALSRALWQEGMAHLAVKPVQTGVVQINDADASLYSKAHVGLDVPRALAGRTLISYTLPASPHLAAAHAGESLSASCVLTALSGIEEHVPLLLEGAGGLYVPLNAHESMLDVMQAVCCPVVLVMRNTLGALNHTLLSLDALRQRAVPVQALICKDVDMPSTEQEKSIRADNRAYLQAYAARRGIELYVMPYVETLDENGWDVLAESIRPLALTLVSMWQGADAAPQEEQMLAWDKAHLWHPYTSATEPLPVYEVTHTKGTRLYLRDGRALIDGMSSWWCAVHGYGHAALVHAAQEQVARMSHVMFGGISHAPAIQAGQKLLTLLPQGSTLSRIFWADSGSVAVEVALKMALQYQQGMGQGQRTKVLSPRGGYYGDTLGAMAVCDPITGMHSLFNHVLPQHIFVERPNCTFDVYDDAVFDAASLAPLEEAFAVHGHELAAVILEPVVQGAGGMYFYHPLYVQRVRELCDAHAVLLILDEIATGFGRTGKMFAHEWCAEYGKRVNPDILCVGKALTGGMMTLAASLCTEIVAQGICNEGNVFVHGPTFMANPLACAVAAASLDVLEHSAWQKQVQRIEAELRQGLAPCMLHASVREVRVLGAIGVVEMHEPVCMAKLQAFFVQEGVWIRPFGRLVYIMPPFVSSADDISTLCAAVCKAVEQGVCYQ